MVIRELWLSWSSRLLRMPMLAGVPVHDSDMPELVRLLREAGFPDVADKLERNRACPRGGQGLGTTSGVTFRLYSGDPRSA
jgi:hypothetical protein